MTYSKGNDCTSTPSKQLIKDVSACISPIFNSSPMKESKLSLGDTIKKFITAFTVLCHVVSKNRFCNVYIIILV